VVANGIRIKSYISSVRVGEAIVTDQERKKEVFTTTYVNLLGSIQNSVHNIILEALETSVAEF
jgi:hypothetical protein